MERNRRVSAFAALLCGCALVIAATALEQSLSPDVYSPTRDLGRSPPGGLLFLLLAWLFRLFGLSAPEGIGTLGTSVFGNLVSLLGSNATELVGIAALVVLSGGIWLAARRVDVAERLGGFGANASQETAPRERPESLRTVESANEVYGAWLAVVRRVSSDPSRSRTPSEWAERAIDAGLDSDAVDSVTDVFREVRYDGAPVTEDAKRRVRDALARLDAEQESNG